jgi:hypothetical protein
VSAMINTGIGELTAGQLGEQAAQAVRALNHLTRPALGALSDPVEAAELIAALASVTGGLPQLTGQLASWLSSEDRTGRLRVDADSPHHPAGTAAAVMDATAALTQAGQCAHAAGRALDAAHQVLARLAAPTGRHSELGGRP